MSHKFQNDILASNPASIDVTADDQGSVSGYGAVFGNKDRGGDIILPGAFTKSLAKAQDEGFVPIMAWQHDMAKPVGKWTAIRETAKGLWVEGKFNLKTSLGKDTYQHVLAGDLNGLSIGYTTPKGGREYMGKGVFHLKEVEVWEVSIVSLPMNPAAQIEAVKQIDSKSEAVEFLKNAGLSRKAAQRFAAGGWRAMSNGYDQAKLDRLADTIEQATNKIRS